MSNPTTKPWINIQGSRFFLEFLQEQQISLGFTTYQTGKLFLVGRKPDNSLALFERTYSNCMGAWTSPDAQTLWVSSRYQIWRFEKTPASAVPYRHSSGNDDTATGPDEISSWPAKGYDVAYVPRVGYTTGYLDVHDLAWESSPASGAESRLVFVNTLFGCLATFSERASFKPLWKPPFLSALVPEDRCHLNGLAMKNGRAAFVSCVGQSDVVDGWRDQRRDGGCILDVSTGETVCAGLSMPHSPRWYREDLWVLNSGTGEFGRVELNSGRFEPIAFCPGYLRGMVFCGDYAVVTLSKPRHASFHGLNLDDKLAQRNAQPQCGLQVINLKTGTVEHWLRVDGNLVTELYDSIVLPGVRQPMAVGFLTDEIERLVVIDEDGCL